MLYNIVKMDDKELELLYQRTLYFRTGQNTEPPNWYFFDKVAEAIDELKKLRKKELSPV